MALHFDYTACDGRESWTQRDMEILDRLIWGTIVVDIGTITHANIAEWQFRMRMVDRLLGDYFVMKYEGGERFFIGPEILRRFVGLRCNVSELSRTKWLKKVVSQASQKVESLVMHEMHDEAMADLAS